MQAWLRSIDELIKPGQRVALGIAFVLGVLTSLGPLGIVIPTIEWLNFGWQTWLAICVLIIVIPAFLIVTLQNSGQYASDGRSAALHGFLSKVSPWIIAIGLVFLSAWSKASSTPRSLTLIQSHVAASAGEGTFGWGTCSYSGYNGLCAANATFFVRICNGEEHPILIDQFEGAAYSDGLWYALYHIQPDNIYWGQFPQGEGLQPVPKRFNLYDQNGIDVEPYHSVYGFVLFDFPITMWKQPDLVCVTIGDESGDHWTVAWNKNERDFNDLDQAESMLPSSMFFSSSSSRFMRFGFPRSPALETYRPRIWMVLVKACPTEAEPLF